MIGSAEEFIRLREMNDERATHDDAPDAVWVEILDRFPAMREWVLHNKTVPVDVLRRLAQDPDSNVRYAVAIKRKCPPDLMEQLAHDPDESVRYGVVFNAKAPTSVLRVLTHDTSARVANKAIDRLASCEAST
jgi:hypothetical protein